MKKSMIFLLIGCLALLISGSIFAATPALPSEGNMSYSGSITGDASTATAKATVHLKAYVAPYASVSFFPPIYKKANGMLDTRLNFTGAPNETRYGFAYYRLETNCDVNVDGFGTAFKGNTYNTIKDKLETWYSLSPTNSNADANPPVPRDGDWRKVGDSGYAWAPEAFDHKFIPERGSFQLSNPGFYRVDFKVKTKDEISDQRAGGYTGSYTVTVWAPHNINAE